MSTLYEIDERIKSCVDQETGEIIDEAMLDQLEMERGQKIESVALWIKDLQADAEAIKTEKDALDKRMKGKLRKADGLKHWLTYALAGKKFETPKAVVSFRRSEAVEIVDDRRIPADYIQIIEDRKIDKAAIKQAIKADVKVPGAVLVERQNVQIK